MASIKQLLDRAWSASDERNRIKGKLGKPDGAGGFTVAVTNRPGFAYVRLSREGIQSVTVARNLGNVALRAGLPVELRERNGNFVIIGVDSVYLADATAADDPNEFGVTKHTHRIDSGLTYEIEPERFEPGRVYFDEDFTVYVNPFRYHYNGAWAYWEGGRIDLTAELPTTATKWAWVLVGIDPETNSAIAVGGAEVASQALLSLSDLADIAFSDYIPCAAIQCAEADADLSDFTRYFDAHAWFTAHLDFNDLNDPGNVTTATNAAGNSPWAARDDHLHGIADNAVTFAKVQDIASDRLLGRDTASSGDPEEITVGGGLEFTGSGGVQRSALTGDVTASAGSNTTTIATSAVSDAKLRLSDALSVMGRSVDSVGQVGDIQAGAGTDAVLREAGAVLAFGTVATGGLADDAVTNAKLANMVAGTVKGRAVGAGTGDPTDLSAAQVSAIVTASAGGILHVTTGAIGNVGAGEDTLASYSVAGGQLAATGDSLWFEATGRMAANSNNKRVRVRFGASGVNLLYATASTAWGTDWSVRGRIIRTGATSQLSNVSLISDTLAAATTNEEPDQTLASANTLAITGESDAAADDDVILLSFVVGWQPAP